MNFSLQKRLTWRLALLLVAVLAMQWGVVELILGQIIREHVTSRLAHDADTLLSQLRLDPDGGAELSPARIDPIYQKPWSGHYYALRVKQVTLRSRSLWDGTLPLPTLATGTETLTSLTGPRQQPLLLLTREFVKLGHAVTISVAEDMSDINRGVARLQFWHAVLAFMAIGILLVLQRRTLRHGLQPLDEARKEIHRLEHGEVDHLHNAHVPLEILPFVDEINSLVTTLLRRMQRSRHATSNLAHAIKTPLTLLLQLAHHPNLAAHEALQETLRQQVTTIRRLTDRELKRVRLAGSGTPAMRVNLQEELTALVATLKMAHRSKELTITLDVSARQPLPMDREDLLELGGNLLDNACKWARHAIHCQAIYDATTVTLLIEDDGPGCPAEHLNHLPERGIRADATTPGSGIGLDIVQEIVKDYAGELRLGQSNRLGGFSAQVTLSFS
ncbi:MAG: sensor histidine kinase [Magnetococcus sp. DMHC-1]